MSRSGWLDRRTIAAFDVVELPPPTPSSCRASPEPNAEASRPSRSPCRCTTQIDVNGVEQPALAGATPHPCAPQRQHFVAHLSADRSGSDVSHRVPILQACVTGAWSTITETSTTFKFCLSLWEGVCLIRGESCCLIDVVRAGSITAAATGLNYTTSAISPAGRQLEVEAGQPLLERHARGIRLTEAGSGTGSPCRAHRNTAAGRPRGAG